MVNYKKNKSECNLVNFEEETLMWLIAIFDNESKCVVKLHLEQMQIESLYRIVCIWSFSALLVLVFPFECPFKIQINGCAKMKRAIAAPPLHTDQTPNTNCITIPKLFPFHSRGVLISGKLRKVVEHYMINSSTSLSEAPFRPFFFP